MIVAIDQSLSNSGICIMTDTGDYSLFNIIPKKLRGTERLEYIKVELVKLLNENIFYKKYVHYDKTDLKGVFGIMEGYSYGSIGRTFELGELGGVVKMVFKAFSISLEVVPPSTWKKAIVGKGNYNKDRVKLEVYQQYGIKFKDDNLCDAWCMAQYLRQKLYK